MTRYETCVVVCGHTPIMMHPRLPVVPLQAGAVLRRGDVCWIDEDGRVYPIAVLTGWRGPTDGMTEQDYSAGVSCTLATPVHVWQDWHVTIRMKSTP
jgi:hypothetical protein